MSWEDFISLSQLIVPLAVPIAGYVAFILRGIRDELRTLNGRIITLESWHAMHDKQDDERHKENQDAIRRMERRR